MSSRVLDPELCCLMYLVIWILQFVPGRSGMMGTVIRCQEHVLTDQCLRLVCLLCSADSGSDSGRCGCSEAGGSQVKEMKTRNQLMGKALQTDKRLHLL
jgi:hypothetical protein